MTRRRRHLRTKRGLTLAEYQRMSPRDQPLAFCCPRMQHGDGHHDLDCPTSGLASSRHIDRILAESQPVHDTVKRTDDPDTERAQWAAVWSKP